MKLLNINSYYFSSSVHRALEDSLLGKDIDMDTYVPLSKSYDIREECDFTPKDHVNASNCYGKYDRIIFHYKHWKILKDIKAQYNFKEYDIMHAHSLFSNGYIAYKLWKEEGTPYIVTVRNTDLNVFFKRMVHLRGLGVAILKHAKAIIFLSEPYRDSLIDEYIKEDLKKEIRDKSYIIPSGINSFWLENRVSKPKELSSPLKLVFAGMINKNKNLDTLLKAIKLLREKEIPVELTIAGKVMDEVVEVSLKGIKGVRLLGRVDKEELIEVYRASHIFTMPSITESFGLVYAEAMTQALPIVYTKGQGFDGQFLDGEVGYAVEALNEREIMQVITYIIEDYTNISQNALERSARYNWNTIAEEFIKIYKN